MKSLKIVNDAKVFNRTMKVFFPSRNTVKHQIKVHLTSIVTNKTLNER